MASLRVGEHEARIALDRVPHKRFKGVINTYWRVDPDGGIDGRSVCWLFRWAKADSYNESAAEAARLAFDEIVDVSFNRFNAAVDYDWTGKARYSKTRAAVEAELRRLLG